MKQPFEDRFSLEAKVVVLTGAAGHLGSTCAEGLGQSGANLILTDISQEPLKALCTRLQKSGIVTTSFVGDITKDSDIMKLVELADSLFGKIDILVNNAYSPETTPFHEIKREHFERANDITTSTAFILVQKFLPLLKEGFKQSKTLSSVINMATMYGIVSPDPRIYGTSGHNNPPYYGAAKAGLIQLTRYLACHLANEGIRVNSVSPGAFPRPEIAMQNPTFYQKLCDKSPLNRIGKAEDLIGALVFLASNASSFITGHNLVVDGGWTAW